MQYEPLLSDQWPWTISCITCLADHRHNSYFIPYFFWTAEVFFYGTRVRFDMYCCRCLCHRCDMWWIYMCNTCDKYTCATHYAVRLLQHNCCSEIVAVQHAVPSCSCDEHEDMYAFVLIAYSDILSHFHYVTCIAWVALSYIDHVAQCSKDEMLGYFLNQLKALTFQK